MNSHYEEEMLAEEGARLGDPRCCPRHPHVKTSSNDGMFDAPCGECEYQISMADESERWDALPESEKEAILASLEADRAAEVARGVASLTDEILF